MADIQARSSVLFDQSVTSLPGIDLNEANQIELLQSFTRFYREVPFTDRPHGGHRYYFDNPYFSYGDGVILYSFLRYFSPRRLVEVGSGYSSALMLDVQDLVPGSAGHITCIEPFPDRLLGLVRKQDANTLRIERCKVQDSDMNLLYTLEANDVLFIDSSHVGKTGSDVLHLLFTIVPSLKTGVIVHLHDVLWPFEYPKHWLEDGRAWNEALSPSLTITAEPGPGNSVLQFLHGAASNVTGARHCSQGADIAEFAGYPGNSSIWPRVGSTNH